MTVLATLKSRHVVVALLVAPLLAVGAWYAVGFWVAGDAMTAKPAEQGVDYPLLERSGCRYSGGRCVLVNGDLELAISLDTERRQWRIQPSTPVSRVLIGFSEGPATAAPLAAKYVDDAWLAPWAGFELVPTNRLQLVVVSGGTRFYGEASLTFAIASD